MHQQHPDFLRKAILVGGAACMFYRSALARAADPLFPVPAEAETDASLWLSKDADFTNVEPGDFPEHPPLPLGRLQVGVRLSALDFAETVRAAGLEFSDHEVVPILVADPLELYREKQACVAKLSRPQDQAHLRLLEVYLAYELALVRRHPDPAELVALEARYRHHAPELL